MIDSIPISIGVPFYNSEAYLEDCICSVLAQTHTKWELILVDDGSTDESLPIALQYQAQDSRIRVISDGVNKKLPFRLNQLIQESKHDYIARMDSDDLMSNDRLQKQLQCLQANEQLDFVSTGCLTIGKNNELTGVQLGKDFQMDAAMILQGGANIVHASILARKSWYLRNLYNVDNLQAEDYELWLTAAKRNDLNYKVLEEPLYWYRVVENVTYDKLIKGYDSQIRVINDNYKGLISTTNKIKVLSKFRAKKALVTALDKLNLLDLLLSKRSDPYNDYYLQYYQKNYQNIMLLKGNL